MPTTISQDLTVTDLLQLLNQKVSSHEDSSFNKDSILDTSTTLSQNTTNKRIGLMKIDPKVYELLDNSCSELFE